MQIYKISPSRFSTILFSLPEISLPKHSSKLLHLSHLSLFMEQVMKAIFLYVWNFREEELLEL